MELSEECRSDNCSEELKLVKDNQHLVEGCNKDDKADGLGDGTQESVDSNSSSSSISCFQACVMVVAGLLALLSSL
jgi:hypothetical protein